MKSNMILPDGANPDAFKEYFLEYLGTNLSESLCNSISNLLAIDYSGRLKSAPELKEYINTCALRIKKHLGLKVVSDESFSSAMSLFTVAITPEKDIDTDEDKSQEQSQDALIDSMIATHFADLSPDEVILIKSLIKELLNGKDGKEMMNAISSNPKLFYSVVISALRENKKQKEISEVVQQHLTTIISKQLKVQKQQVGFKGLISKVSLAGSLMIAASTGLVLGGLLLPALIIPATISAVKIAPILGEKVADTILKDAAPIPLKESKNIIVDSGVTDKKNSITKTTKKTVEHNLRKKELKDLVKTIDIKEKIADKNINQSKTEKVLLDKKLNSKNGRTI